MKIYWFLVMGVFFISCTKQANKINSVEITPLLQDSLSIRAISPVDTNKTWFTANKGVVGLLSGKEKKVAIVKYDEKPLQFRAIARTSQAVFVLSIENPAVLYKIGYKNDEATNIEEVYLENKEGVFYDAMAFWNDKEGIAVGDPTGKCLSVITTNDGGNTWKKLPCNMLPKVEKGEAAFAASNTNIKVLGNQVWIVSGGKKARVFYSKDKGKSWEVFKTPMIQGKAMTGIYSVDFYDKNTGIIVGGDWEHKNFNEGNKAITLNGGKSWKLLANGKIPGYLSCVQFVPNSNGEKVVAVSTNGIFVSNNQGSVWQQLSSEGFYAIKFVNDSIAFASGKNKISKLKFK